MKNQRLLPLLFACASLFGLGCGDDDAPAEKPTCEEIVEACHEVDPGSGPIHECHENAEAATATEASCAADRTSCLAICAAAAMDAGPTDLGTSDDAGTSEDAGASDDAGATDDAGASDDAGAADDAG